MKRQERKETANKGFSLVELIIVVAIMAVLIGVLAPQYLKYVERSRESADLNNYQNIITALQVNAADSEGTVITPGTITFEKGKNPVFGPSTGKTNAQDILASVSADPGKITTKSEKYGNAVITITVSDGVPAFTTDNTDLAGALGIATTPAGS